MIRRLYIFRDKSAKMRELQKLQISIYNIVFPYTRGEIKHFLKCYSFRLRGYFSMFHGSNFRKLY